MLQTDVADINYLQLSMVSAYYLPHASYHYQLQLCQAATGRRCDLQCATAHPAASAARAYAEPRRAALAGPPAGANPQRSTRQLSSHNTHNAMRYHLLAATVVCVLLYISLSIMADAVRDTSQRSARYQEDQMEEAMKP
jgi:hypothetical protein